MGFNLQGVLDNARQVTESSNSKGIKVIYPQEGRLKVKLLFNPKSGVVLKKYDVHKINDNRIYCLSQYGKECPVCKSIENIQNTTGADLWKFKRVTRAVAYAVYVGHKGYVFNDSRYEPKPGDIVMVMLPWTLYSSINRIIADEEVDAEALVASNVGPVLSIDRTKESNQTKYSCFIDVANVNYQIKESEAEFMEMMNDLPSLDEAYAPPEITDELISKAVDASNQLEAKYLSDEEAVTTNVGNTGSNLASINEKLADALNQTKPQGQDLPSLPTESQPTVSRPQQTDAQGNVFEFDGTQWILVKKAELPPLPIIDANTPS